MGTKSKTLVEPANAELIPERAAALDEAVATMAALEASYAPGRDLANQLLGQAQVADAFARFSLTVSTSKLAHVKENKLYQSLRGMRTADGQQFLRGTWEEFCGLLGRSHQQVDEDLRNLKAMGAEALDAMSRMGIGYRELRQYRRLDGDQQQLLIEAAKTGDKAEFLDLAEQLIGKHAAEKKALMAENESLKADAQASNELLDKKNARIDKLEREKALIARLPPDEALAQLKREASDAAAATEAMVLGRLRQAVIALRDHGAAQGNPTAQDVFAAGLLGQVMTLLIEVRDEFALPDVVGDGRPDWERWAEANPIPEDDAPAH